MRRDVFQAIADPTRRQIITLLATNSRNLNAVAEKFEVSRPAISKHIRILTECGLVTIKKEVRERFCMISAGKLKEVSDWLRHFEQFWDDKLVSLKKHVENESKPRRKGSNG